MVGAKYTTSPKGLGMHPEYTIASFFLFSIKIFNAVTVAGDYKEYNNLC